MPVEVILPKVDMDMTSGTISKWHVREGDRVGKGALLFEIETDKAAMEVESPGEGIIRQISAPEGTSVPVGTPVAFLYAPDEKLETSLTGRAPVAAGQPPSPVPALPNLRQPDHAESRVRATPLARRLARQKGIALETITGSGPHGRIVAADVQAAPAAVEPPSSAITHGESTATAADLYPAGSYSVLSVDNMRRTIASRLTHSKQTVPHFYLSASCCLDQLLLLRDRLNQSAPSGIGSRTGVKLTINDFIIKALALALQRVPRANVSWNGDSILQHHASDVAVAVAVENGLLTPVIRSAAGKPLGQIAAEMRDLAERARSGRLAPAEYRGGTSTLSNLGMYGIEEFTAILNPPHATILAVGASRQVFVPEDGRPVLRTQMTCTLSCDHRAIDGVIGAQLLTTFRSFIEEPGLMLV